MINSKIITELIKSKKEKNESNNWFTHTTFLRLYNLY